MKKIVYASMFALGLLSTLVRGATTVATPAALPAPMSKAFGIYCLPAGEMPGQTLNLTGKDNLAMWQATYYTGVALRSTWSLVQPSSGTAYDWTFFDTGVSQAKTYNKKISLSIAAGAFCPSWLINAGAKHQSVTLNLSFEPTAEKMTMVYPWDPTFQKNWSALVSAMAAKYDGNPNVGYVYIGGAGNYIESFVVQNQADYNTFAAAGGLPSWITGTEAIIDMYGTSFKNTPFMLAVGNPVGNIASEQSAGQSAVQTVITYALAKYPGRFGIVNQGLCSTTDSTSTWMGLDYFLNQDINQNAENTPVGFQTVTSAAASKSSLTLGTLSGALSAGIALGGHFIEVYKVDCMNTANETLLKDDDAALKLN